MYFILTYFWLAMRIINSQEAEFFWIFRSASPKLLVKGEGDQSHPHLHNDASAVCVPRVNISLPAPRAACQSQ